MPLAFQVAGVLVAMWTLQMLLRRIASTRRSRALAIALVPPLLATALVASLISPTVSSLFREARRNSAFTPAAAAIAGSAGPGANAAFLSWAAETIPPTATYMLIGGSPVALWVSYQLTPRRAVDDPRHAQWLVLYGTSAASLGPARALFGPERTYAPRLGIAQRIRG